MKKKKFKIQPKTWPKEYTFEEFQRLNPNIAENVLINYYHKYLQEYAENQSRHIKHFNDNKNQLVKELKQAKEDWNFETYDKTVGESSIVGGRSLTKDRDRHINMERSLHLSGGATIEVYTKGVGVSFKPLKEVTVNVWLKLDGDFSSSNAGNMPTNEQYIVDNFDRSGYGLYWTHGNAPQFRWEVYTRDSGSNSYGGRIGVSVDGIVDWEATFGRGTSGSNDSQGTPARFPNGYGNGPLVRTGTNGGTKRTVLSSTNQFNRDHPDPPGSGTWHQYVSNSPHSGSVGWHMITGMFDGRYLRMYANAMLVNETDAGENCEGISWLDSQHSQDVNMIIGGERKDTYTNTNPGDHFITGSISNLSIWSKALDSKAIIALYESGSGCMHDIAAPAYVTEDKRNKLHYLHKYRKNLELWLRLDDIKFPEGVPADGGHVEDYPAIDNTLVPDSSGNNVIARIRSGENAPVNTGLSKFSGSAILTGSKPFDDLPWVDPQGTLTT